MQAGELLFFNKKITAQEAEERNLVTRVFPENVFKKETDALVAYYSTLPPKVCLYLCALSEHKWRIDVPVCVRACARVCLLWAAITPHMTLLKTNSYSLNDD